MRASAPTVVHLLDIDPELASRLREDDRAEARDRLQLRTTVVAPGPWSLADLEPQAHPFGVVIVDGLLQREVSLHGRTSLQLLGRGDVVLPQAHVGEHLDAAQRWRAAVPTRVAVLDDRLQGPLTLWPGLAVGLLDRVGRQSARLAVQAAIAQLPRVEDRLEATFWELADRWGRVTASGIHLPLQLTHELLARMVGGRRPTISLALTALGEREVVLRQPDGSWLIVARSPSLLPSAEAPALPLVEPTATADRATRMPSPEPWQLSARRELLATARRVGADHAVAAQRLRHDHDRYEATRRRSQELREQTMRDRAERAAGRGERLSRRAPAGPSAGSRR